MLSLLVLPLLMPLAASQTCHALIQSGGGSHGAYEAGALAGLISVLPAAQVEYYITVGISAGALNSVGLCQFPMGQEPAASAFITSMWQNLGGMQNVLKDWPGGLAQGIFFESALWDSSPEFAYVKNSFQKPIVRNASLGVMNLDSGDYGTFTESIGKENFFTVAMCSSAIPGVFPTVKYQDGTYVDGGVAFHMDVFEGIRRCQEVTSNLADIVVDMMSCRPHTLNPDFEKLTTMKVYERANEIHAYEYDMKHVLWAMTMYPSVVFRYYLQPSEELPGFLPMDFEPAAINKSIGIGMHDAVYNVQNNIYAPDVIHQWINQEVIYIE
jgi:hypothetical protein